MSYRWHERDNIGVLSPGSGPMFPAHNHSELFEMRHTIFMDLWCWLAANDDDEHYAYAIAL
jgi:hypothetical protein